MSKKSLANLFNQPTNVIDCGIGNIEYHEPDNLLLQQLMENFEMALKKNTPAKINEVLKRLT